MAFLAARQSRGRSLRTRSRPADAADRRAHAIAADDAEAQVRLAAFHQGLALSGWTIGRNVRVDTRWGAANAAQIRRHAEELVALAPDVILSSGAGPLGAMLQVTRTGRSCSWSCPIRLAAASLTVWRDLAATPAAS